jgi:hypothetical protein
MERYIADVPYEITSPEHAAVFTGRCATEGIIEAACNGRPGSVLLALKQRTQRGRI